ncbi:MAG: sulfite exporter TauE/SafE family protein [Bacteroidales bacterium]|nr:sulfite exporter TauE/SafE family protein [Bacteroidales bacterium]
MTDYLLIALLAVCASFIQRTTGFGFGVFIMTALPFLMPSYGEATALSGILSIFTTLIICIRMYRYIVWKRLWPILITFIVTSFAAIYLLTLLPVRTLLVLLGFALILTSVYFLFVGGRLHPKPTTSLQITTGVLSGLLGGFFGMQGPPVVLYFVSSEPDKNHYMGIISAYFLLGNLAMTLFRAYHGFVTQAVALASLPGLLGIVIGTFLGSVVFEKIPAKAFRYVVYSYIGICGIIVLITL